MSPADTYHLGGTASDVSRRAMLAGLGVAGGTAALRGAANLVAADAELLRLGNEFEALWEEERAAWAVSAAAGSRACDATRALAERILPLPATTLEGLRVKARAVAWCHAPDPLTEDSLDEALDLRMVGAILRDLLAINGRPGAVA